MRLALAALRLGAMMVCVVLATEPAHVERLGIVIVVRISFWLAARLARLAEQPSSRDSTTYSPSREMPLPLGRVVSITFLTVGGFASILWIGKILPLILTMIFAGQSVGLYGPTRRFTSSAPN